MIHIHNIINTCVGGGYIMSGGSSCAMGIVQSMAGCEGVRWDACQGGGVWHTCNAVLYYIKAQDLHSKGLFDARSYGTFSAAGIPAL